MGRLFRCPKRRRFITIASTAVSLFTALLVYILAAEPFLNPIALGDDETVNIQLPNQHPAGEGPTDTSLEVTTFDENQTADRGAFLKHVVNPQTPGKTQPKVRIICLDSDGKLGKVPCEQILDEIKRVNGKKVESADYINLESEDAQPESVASTAPKGKRIGYRATYTVIRSALTLGTSATTIIVTHGADWTTIGQAAFVGSLAAGWSAGMQYWNKEYLAWLSSNKLFRAETEKEGGAGMALFKKLISSAAYATLLHTGMVASGLEPQQELVAASALVMSSAGKSIFTQTFWQKLNHMWTRRAIAANPGKEAEYRKYSAMGSLFQSMFMTMTNALNLTGNPLGDLIAEVVGGTGALVYYGKYLNPKTYIARTGRTTAAQTCQENMAGIAAQGGTE